ncbi:hypothetical protein O0544_09235 [Edwardsiella anguillarum]|nr:hypothetical protein [Edwardsiella anguillarum]
MLHHFQSQLRDDFQRTVERFLALQTLGTDSARQDARALKSVVLAQPMPSAAVLNGAVPAARNRSAPTAGDAGAAVAAPLWRAGRPGSAPGGAAGGCAQPARSLADYSRCRPCPFISHPAPFCAALCDFAGGASA